MSERKKVLVVVEDQHDDGTGRYPSEPRLTWSETAPFFMRGRKTPLGVEFTTPGGKSLVVPEGSTARVVTIGD